MKEYTVLVPITGYVEVIVDAESEQDAIDKAMDDEDINLDDVVEWDMTQHITEGNIFYGIKNDIEVFENEY